MITAKEDGLEEDQLMQQFKSMLLPIGFSTSHLFQPKTGEISGKLKLEVVKDSLNQESTITRRGCQEAFFAKQPSPSTGCLVVLLRTWRSISRSPSTNSSMRPTPNFKDFIQRKLDNLRLLEWTKVSFI